MRVMTGQMTKRARVTGRTLGWKQSRMEYLNILSYPKIRLLNMVDNLIWAW